MGLLGWIVVVVLILLVLGAITIPIG